MIGKVTGGKLVHGGHGYLSMSEYESRKGHVPTGSMVGSCMRGMTNRRQ